MIHDLIDQASYMAHGYCLLWKPWLVALHAGSDFLIFAAYFAIPVAIWIFLQRRPPDLEMRRIAILFAAFIFLCGLSSQSPIVDRCSQIGCERIDVAGGLRFCEAHYLFCFGDRLMVYHWSAF